MKWVQAQLKDDLYLELKEFTVRRGIQMNEFFLEALKTHLENTKRKEDVEAVVTETLSSLEERQNSKQEDSNE